ncbi:uncharacterized protein LOC110858189 [Folsomia candida]|uniref:uncharacterized protein LOC110858189 n=1 Tax=Folsomia candida TaxID=158441 RepID=UPI001604D28B|nr:uncharacterized protein LOC110858189 [Folsomia candida]
MAVLTTCCCKYSVRQGSFGAGCYTLVYFLLFALLTGNVSYNEVVSRQFFSSSNSTKTTTPTNATASTLPPPDAPIPTTDMVLICVDFLCEIAGFVASIVLLKGLQVDKRGYLVPWLILVPLHTLIDTFTVINIIILYMEHAPSQDAWWGIVTSLTITLDFLLNFINVYAFLCVVSQYQEYLAGRGSAAYEGYPWRDTNTSVRYEAGGDRNNVGGGGGGGTSGCGGGGRSNGSNPCFSVEGEKSDVWCEDLVLDKLDFGDRKACRRGGHEEEDDDDDDDEWGGQDRKPSNVTSTTMVRFDCDEDGASGSPPPRPGQRSRSASKKHVSTEGRVTLWDD